MDSSTSKPSSWASTSSTIPPLRFFLPFSGDPQNFNFSNAVGSPLFTIIRLEKARLTNSFPSHPFLTIWIFSVFWSSISFPYTSFLELNYGYLWKQDHWFQIDRLLFHSFKLHSFRDFNLFLLVLFKISLDPLKSNLSPENCDWKSLDPLKSKVHKIAQMVLIFWLIKIAQRLWLQWWWRWLLKRKRWWWIRWRWKTLWWGYRDGGRGGGYLGGGGGGYCRSSSGSSSKPSTSTKHISNKL